MAFVLTIAERGHSWAGRPPLASVHDTEAEARAELVEYVRERWDAEMDGMDQPADEDELVACYFEDVLERYTIAQTS